MNHREARDRADAYLDGTLGRRERGRLERHLASCPDCRGEVASIRSLREQARGLPRKMEPGRDLWPGIEARLDPRTAPPAVPKEGPWDRLLGRGLREALAAAAALAVLVLGVVSDRDREPDPEARIASAPAIVQGDSRAVLSRIIWGLEEESRGAGRTLIAAVRESSNPMVAEGVQGIDRSLKVLDRAIAEATAALRADPDNPVLLRRLSGYYRQRLTLMEQATYLAASS